MELLDMDEYANSQEIQKDNFNIFVQKYKLGLTMKIFDTAKNQGLKIPY